MRWQSRDSQMQPPRISPCPMCKYALLTSRPLERTRRLPSDSAPTWMRPWGYAFTIIGGLALASGVIGEYSASRNPPMVAVIVSGLLNPIFFIGFPLGVYWVRRSKKAHPLAAIDSGKPDSTVPCEEQEQPCTVNRTDDAMHWYHTKVGLWTIGICLCIITGIIAGIYFSGPPQGPAIASTPSEGLVRPSTLWTTKCSGPGKPSASWTSSTS